MPPTAADMSPVAANRSAAAGSMARAARITPAIDSPLNRPQVSSRTDPTV